ncbi:MULTISPECIES: 4'-phosphopantetheinyl transferase family protein [Cupriavidus]|uniref:4'-phosphopantetheinyl transferase superfamily protein n=1 Tax=Cupriavidus pauculus TaxID=82633 RepID=A0A3G8H4Y7_9BURK|nr:MULTISPECIES: 4'-phosphopantetheinyl transferase superfamily protein [Cupriavidus]AZG15494.1 4'-phosphopantetheinyl transferase superfamily protein [Cupriavidus pauculus]MDT6961904.1 4'-phosphopantetheinyl transferase superfamily protein [Cupriavidus sp. SZY C1]
MPLALRTGSVMAFAAMAPPVSRWMSPEELARLAEMRAQQRAEQFAAGRWLARRLLAVTFGGDASEWALSAAEDAPPLATHTGGMVGTPVFVSIAHSGDHLACAVSDMPVGVDIEELQPRKHLDTLIEATTTEAERAALPALLARGDDDARMLAFFQLWTLKEAWIKCHGGNLFQTMVGHVVQAVPAPLEQANGLTWQRKNAVLALAAATLVDELELPQATGWRLDARETVD